MQALQKTNQILLFILLFFVLLYFGSPFLVPFVFGVFFASLMTPFSNMLERVRIPRVFSSLLSTLMIFIIVGSILYILMKQVSIFVSDISFFKEEVQMFIENIQDRIKTATGLTLDRQQKIWENRSADIINSIENSLSGFLGNFFNTMAGFLLVLVYMFLLLYYRSRFVEFVTGFIKKDQEKETADAIRKTSRVVHHYLFGRAKVMALLSIMYYITFLIFDIPYAGFLTIFGALITIIPYLGPFVSGVLPIIFSIIYLQELQVILLFAVIIFIEQMIESYVFEPLIIGSEVKINPLFVIIAVLLGGMVWGLAGMVLFVPMFAIAKIISTHVQGLQPFGRLLGPSNQSVND
ncbi:MAG: AI-2E family transporter [Bacteroidales bacterium]